MDTMDGTTQTGTELDINPCRQKASPQDGRARTSAANGKLGGRPRGTGMQRVDWAKYLRLAMDGLSQETIADRLGVSVRTLKRRIAERQQEDAPFSDSW